MSQFYPSLSFREEFKALRAALVEYISNLDYSQINTDCEAAKILYSYADKENVCVLDFNYTESISRLLSTVEFNVEHIKIHGSAYEKKIVFGVHDNARIEDEHVFLRKAVSGAIFKDQSVGKIMRSASKSVVVFGHSLGITDNTQFEAFFNLKSNEKCCAIDIHYHSEDSYYDLYQNIDYMTVNKLQAFSFRHDFKMIGPDIEDV